MNAGKTDERVKNSMFFDKIIKRMLRMLKGSARETDAIPWLNWLCPSHDSLPNVRPEI